MKGPRQQPVSRGTVVPDKYVSPPSVDKSFGKFNQKMHTCPNAHVYPEVPISTTPTPNNDNNNSYLLSLYGTPPLCN